ncbi:MAG: hypothetical protein Q9227_004257 [Pyrenula ochraceoflavens]
MEAYQSFLASPKVSDLSDDAILAYVTVVSSIQNSASIVKHLTSTEIRHVIQKIIGTVDGGSNAFYDIENTIQFVAGGGKYLPGLDEFIVDKTLTFPSFHVVSYDADHKINHIRVHWDQGALLKQAGVIGVRGKNWPIAESKDQLRMVSTANTKTSNPSRGRTAASARPAKEEVVVTTSRSVSPTKRPTKDPHGSLDLFAPVEADPNTPPRASFSNVLSPRPSAKPAPRDMNDLFVSAGAENKPPPSPPKGAAGRFAPSRLWDENGGNDIPSLRLKKGNHPSAKQPSHFEFDDFNTPVKPKPKAHNINESHFSLSGEGEDTYARPKAKPRGQEVLHYSIGDEDHEEEPMKPAQSRVHQQRADQKTHFDIHEGTPEAPAHNNKENRVRKDQETHYSFEDQSPAAKAERPTKVKPISSVFSRNFDFSYAGE